MSNFVITGINGQDGYYLAKLVCNTYNVIGVSHHSELVHPNLKKKIAYYQAFIS